MVKWKHERMSTLQSRKWSSEERAQPIGVAAV
jgi:hypothetical protein